MILLYFINSHSLLQAQLQVVVQNISYYVTYREING